MWTVVDIAVPAEAPRCVTCSAACKRGAGPHEPEGKLKGQEGGRGGRDSDGWVPGAGSRPGAGTGAKLSHRLCVWVCDTYSILPGPVSCFIVWDLPGDVLAAPRSALCGRIGVLLFPLSLWGPAQGKTQQVRCQTGYTIREEEEEMKETNAVALHTCR